MEDDFTAAQASLSNIADLINWSKQQAREIAPSLMDNLCEHTLALVRDLTDLGALSKYAERDELNVRTSEIGSIVSDLVNVPGVADFSVAPENIASAQRSSSKGKAPETPAVVKGKGKAKAQPKPKPPPPVPHATRPTRPLPAKLAAAREAVGQPANPWIVAGTKRKSAEARQEETLIALAQKFPSSTTISLRQASSALGGRPLSPTPSQARKKKQRRYTTQGRSRKQVTVYTSPAFPWNAATVFNQINGHLGNAKRSIRVTGIESNRRGISLTTTSVLDDTDLAVFLSLFTNQLANSAPETEIRVEVPHSKSSLKIVDFPYFGLTPEKDEKGKLKPLTTEQLTTILNSSPFAKEFNFYENSGPHLSRNSASSDSGTL